MEWEDVILYKKFNHVISLCILDKTIIECSLYRKNQFLLICMNLKFYFQRTLATYHGNAIILANKISMPLRWVFMPLYFSKYFAQSATNTSFLLIYSITFWLELPLIDQWKYQYLFLCGKPDGGFHCCAKDLQLKGFAKRHT